MTFLRPPIGALLVALLAAPISFAPGFSADLNYFADAEQSFHDERARRLTGAPVVLPCTVVAGVYSRPELSELWGMIRASANLSEARSRVLSRFERFPIIFDGCTMNGQKLRTIVHNVLPDPYLDVVLMPRVVVQTEVISPIGFQGVRSVGVDLLPLGPVQ